MKRHFPINAGVSPSGQEIDDKVYTAVPLRRYVGPVMFLLLSAGLFFYWSGFVLTNSIWTNGYPNYNQFVSSRYSSFEYWTVWLLTLNAVLPILFAIALINNSIEELTRLHKAISIFWILVNLYVFVSLLILWIFVCNNGSSGGAACNDYRWCCVNFPSVWCSNTVACIPAVMGTELVRNSEMTQHFWFSLVFVAISFFHVQINGDLKQFGVLN